MAGEDWRQGLPEDLRGEAMFKDIPDVSTLAKVARDLKSFQGSAIRVPGPDAGPEVRKEFIQRLMEKAPELVLMPSDDKALAEVEDSIWKRLGRPPDDKGYDLKEVKLDEGVQLNEADLRATAKALGLTKSQFAALVKGAAGAQTEHKRVVGEADAALRKEWGAAYEERLLTAKATALKMGKTEAEVSGMSPSDLKAWASVAKSLGGVPRPVGDQGAGGGGGKLSPAEAKARIHELMSEEAYTAPYKNPARHEFLKAKVVELMEQAYPE